MDGFIRYHFLYLYLCATAIGDLCHGFPDAVIINDE